MVWRITKNVIVKAFGKLLQAYERSNQANLKNIPGLTADDTVILRGNPIIDIRPGASIEIGKGVMLNSVNRGYHACLHSPVKLFAENSGSRIAIGDNTRIHGACIHARQSISVGRNCLIAANCNILDSSGHCLSFQDVDDRINTVGETHPVVIEDSVWIGMNVIVLPGVRIGRGSVIAAGSVVTRDVPPMVLAGGIPARGIRTAEHIMSEFRIGDGD